MSDNTSIEWTDAVWNPLTGCTKVSPGCDHCYAKTMHERFNGPGSFDTVELHPERLDQPLRWRKPRRIFVNSMSDLFHDEVPDKFIADVFATMALAPQHTFQLLTKRHGRMRSLLSSDRFSDYDDGLLNRAILRLSNSPCIDLDRIGYPLPNVWGGVSVEDQARAELRIDALRETPFAVRFLSCEPLLGAIDLLRYLRPESEIEAERRYPHHTTICDAGQGGCYHPPCRCSCHREAVQRPGIDWVIVGGESGRGARPMHPDWARSLRDQCVDAGVPFLFKQWGEWRYAIEVDDFAVEQAIKASGQPDPFELTSCYTVGSDGSYSNTEPPREGNATMMRVGKHKAGRELDGRTWDEYPVGAP